ncbi:MAG: CDGSH iron-sulfur domain-containing protein [Methyloligellaceae bacterium]
MADEPVMAQANPYLVDVEEGQTYFWCRCGKSNNQPFCDGSHQGSGLEPLKFVAENTEQLSLCGCKQTEDEPFCDGTHNIL